MISSEMTVQDLVDAAGTKSLIEAATFDPYLYTHRPEDIKNNKKVIKKARWLLKNWYMSKAEWEEFNDGQ